MSPQQTNMIRIAVDGIRADHPKLFAVISATYCARNMAEARRALNYLSADDFTLDYHQALEHLSKRLRDSGYKSPTKTDPFEDRIEWQINGAESKWDTPKLPSQDVIDRWYRGHILHEAIGLIMGKSRTGLCKLWERFPNRREEIEIAFVLAQPQPAPEYSHPLPNKRPKTPHGSPSRLLPAVAGTFALALILLMALSPPNGNRAINAIATNFEDAVLSAQGIFDFSESALAKAEAPGSKPEPAPSTTSAPKPPPRPEIALPDRPKIEMAALPNVPRQLNIPTARIELKTPPRVSTPAFDKGAKPSTYFGSRPNVELARPTLSMPTRGPSTLPPGAAPGQMETSPQTTSADLKGYRPAGRIGFSSFQTSRGLAEELVRLTRIERALSRLKKPHEKMFEGAQLALAPDRARIHFADGIAFSVTFRFGRLDDIQIYARSGIDKKLHTEIEARRGIQFLDRALSNS